MNYACFMNALVTAAILAACDILSITKNCFFEYFLLFQPCLTRFRLTQRIAVTNCVQRAIIAHIADLLAQGAVQR